MGIWLRLISTIKKSLKDSCWNTNNHFTAPSCGSNSEKRSRNFSEKNRPKAHQVWPTSFFVSLFRSKFHPKNHPIFGLKLNLGAIRIPKIFITSTISLRFDWIDPQFRPKSYFHRWSWARPSHCNLLCRFWNGPSDSIYCIRCWSWWMAPPCDRNLFGIVKRHNSKINFTCRSPKRCVKTLFIYATMFEHSRNQSWGESFEILTHILLPGSIYKYRHLCWWTPGYL